MLCTPVLAIGTTRRTVRLLVAALVACVGVASLAGGAAIYAKAALAQVLLHVAWARTQATGAPARPWPWADLQPVARLTAPALGADVLVLSGASGRTLAFGPGLLPGSAPPGGTGNSVLVAHRDTHFRFLRRLVPGDDVVLEGIDGARHRYRVRRSYVADRSAIDLPRATPAPTLTLVTCFPFDALVPGGPLRYIVVAEAS